MKISNSFFLNLKNKYKKIKNVKYTNIIYIRAKRNFIFREK